jgi:hypothetical protein
MITPQFNYNESIVSIVNSIVRDFGLEPRHATLPELDTVLASGKYKNVFLLILDGLGTDILEQHLPPDAFLRRHFLRNLSSVYPPTTAAAIPSFYTGLVPAETGWFGWSQYYPEVGVTATMFSGKDEDTGKPVPGFAGSWNYLPCETVTGRINQSGRGSAHTMNNFGKKAYKNNRQMVRRLLRFSRKRGRQYVYCYNNQPDAEMHFAGTKNGTVTKRIKNLNNNISRLAKKMKNTALIVTADHGHIDLYQSFAVQDSPALVETLATVPELDHRGYGFRVKPGRDADFLREAKLLFGEESRIVSVSDLVAGGCYGNTEGSVYPRLSRLPDYIALAPPGHVYFWHSKDKGKFKSGHGGCERAEATVPLLVCTKQEDR